MKIFKIPVTWEVYDEIEIEAETLEEAIKIFDEIENEGGGFPLPKDPTYLEGSFKREDGKEFIAMCNDIDNEQ